MGVSSSLIAPGMALGSVFCPLMEWAGLTSLCTQHVVIYHLLLNDEPRVVPAERTPVHDDVRRLGSELLKAVDVQVCQPCAAPRSLDVRLQPAVEHA